MTSTLSPQRLFALASAVAFALAMALPSSAQSAGSGAIAGTLTDTAGALIPNATVDIKNLDNGAVRNVTTNSAGYYNAPFLQPGH